MPIKWSNLDALAEKIKHQTAQRQLKKQPSSMKKIINPDYQYQPLPPKFLPQPAPPSQKPRVIPPPPNIVKSTYTKPTITIPTTPDWFAPPDQVDISIIIPVTSAEVISQIDNWHIDDSLVKEIIYVEDGYNLTANIIAAWEHVRHHWNSIGSICGQFKDHVGKIISLDIPTGYATVCNIGAQYASGQYLVFLDPNIIVTHDWIKPLLDVLSVSPGIVGSLQLKLDGTIDSAGLGWLPETSTFEHIGRTISQNGTRLLAPLTKITDQVTECNLIDGHCLAISKKLFEDLQGFDIGYRIHGWADLDLNMRAKELDCKIYLQPNSIVYRKVKNHYHPYLIDNAKRFYDKYKIQYPFSQ